MARKLTTVISRFDGGMTDAIRDTSNPTKFAYISHFDIYRDPNQMYVMPGFESLNGFSGNATGIKVYDIRAFTTEVDGREIYALGTKSDGTGSKIFHITESSSTEWSATNPLNAVEGSDNLVARPFLAYENPKLLFPVEDASSANVLKIGTTGASSYSSYAPATFSIINTSRYLFEKGFNGTLYALAQNWGAVRSLTASALTNVKTTGGNPIDLATGDYTIGIAQTLGAPVRASVLVWDSASLLADQNVRVVNHQSGAIGYVQGTWVLATDSGLYEDSNASSNGNGIATIDVHVVSGETPHRIWGKEGVPAAVYTENDMFPIKGQYDGAMMFHVRMATNTAQTEFYQGVMAVGTNRPDSPIAVSQLLNTSSLGVVETVYNSGRRFYFAHGLDGSVSRLQRFDTGTYDVPATIETLVYGANSPYLKELNGISVVTENLPASASVKVDYRTDVDSAWVELGTSNTTNRQKHVFTRAQGTPIGRFQEIQFRITCTGKIVLKNIKIDITETDDLAF